MKDFHKKESPFQGITGLAGGATGLRMSSSSAKPKYVDEVFKSGVWIGNETARTIETGIDNTKGALAWVKARNDSTDYFLVDTERGANKFIKSNADDVEYNVGNRITGFESNGFNVGTSGLVNGTSAYNYVGWNLRERENFFDIVTYTGTGSSVLTLSHSLGSIPGMILIKRLDGANSDWIVYHRSTGKTKYLKLNSSAAVADDTGDYIWNDTAPTATHFTIGAGHDSVNANTNNYVAYLFAHHDGDGDFGESGDKDAIKCGSYTSNSGGALEVDLGFEPQFLILKNTARNANWAQLDMMRTMDVGEPENHLVLSVNQDYAEQDVDEDCSPVPTPRGFKMAARSGGYAEYNFGSDEIVYVAIRFPDGSVGKPPETGTDVFAMDTADGSTNPSFISNFPVDFSFYKQPASSDSWYTGARLLGRKYLKTESTSAEATSANFKWDFSDGWRTTGLSSNWQAWMWKRHAGFDVVAMDVTTEGGYPYYKHSLGVVPEMIWSKRRDSTSDWTVYHKGLNGGTNAYNWRVRCNESAAQYEDTYVWGLGEGPSSTQFQTKGASFAIGEHIAMLFASVTGISKVGSYTGNGNAIGSSPLTITTGFQPRFLIIKRYDASSWHWNVFDSIRGLGAGNEPRLKLNQSDAQNTGYDWVEVTSTGFKVNGSMGGVGASGGEYIYYAHA